MSNYAVVALVRGYNSAKEGWQLEGKIFDDLENGKIVRLVVDRRTYEQNLEVGSVWLVEIRTGLMEPLVKPATGIAISWKRVIPIVCVSKTGLELDLTFEQSDNRWVQTKIANSWRINYVLDPFVPGRHMEDSPSWTCILQPDIFEVDLADKTLEVSVYPVALPSAQPAALLNAKISAA